MARNDQIRFVPQGIDPPVLREHLGAIGDAINALPQFSTFSFTTPESSVTATIGTIGINVASGVSAMWFKQQGSSNTGWVALA
jgi:hypothetical protein